MAMVFLALELYLVWVNRQAYRQMHKARMSDFEDQLSSRDSELAEA